MISRVQTMYSMQFFNFILALYNMYRFVREHCLRQSSFNDKPLKCSAMGQENEMLFTTASSTEILS